MNPSTEPPTNQDVVLGGNAPPPAQAAILGGLASVQPHLNSSSLAIKFDALKRCTQYGEQGLSLVIQALNDPLPRTRYEAYLLLRNRSELLVQTALKQYKFWEHFPRLYGLPNRHATMFADRKVEEFIPQMEIQDPIATAYALRLPRWSWETHQSIEDNLIELVSTPESDQVEALVFGYWGGGSSREVVDCLLNTHQYLSNLTALFIGDIEDREDMISSIVQSDLSYVLEAYPKLEILKIRGDGSHWTEGLRFSQLHHENLLALTIESGGLSRQAVSDLCCLKIPSLEYLELWLGRDDYGGNSCLEDVMPIISGEAFPNLKYLGLRNAEYSDEIAIALAQSPFLNQLIELDLSLGTLSNEGIEALLNCSAIRSLVTLNIADCYVRLASPRFSELSCQVICDRQKPPYREYGSSKAVRYCTVAE